MVRRPRRTFEALVSRPRSGPLLALLFIVPFVASAALFSTDVGRQALVDQWENAALAFGQPVDDQRYADMQRLSGRGVGYAAVTALTGGPLMAALLALLVHGWFAGVRRHPASYRQALAVVAAASVILMVRQVVAAPLAYLRETTASAVTLGRLVTIVDQASPMARFLSLVDLFVVWWLVVLAVGVGVLYRIRTRDVALSLAGVYVASAAALTGVMAALGGV
jgi:hypothetical protein